MPPDLCRSGGTEALGEASGERVALVRYGVADFAAMVTKCCEYCSARAA